jgi:hypothetical protein
MNITKYFDEAFALFNTAENITTDYLQLAGRTIHLKTPSSALRDLFLFSVSHLVKASGDSPAGLTILYAEDKDLPGRLKAPSGEFNSQGYTPALNEGDIQIYFLPWQQQVFLYSQAKRVGIYWVKSIEHVPWWETTFSFRILFHFWTKNLPAQLVHAGALANKHGAVLITGPSGSGKSTSCLNLLRAGYKYLGDDYVWVELEPAPTVYALYQTAKIEPDNLQERFSDWVPHIKNKDNFQQQKAIFDIKEVSPDTWLDQMPLKAILLPNVAHQPLTVFERTNPINALMAMAPTTLHHLPHHREIAYQKLMNLSKKLPTYYWRLGYEKEQFIASFNTFISNESY